MAERGAFLTSTAISKPSVFEVLAQDSLAATIHPAMKRVADFLSAYRPEQFGWISTWFEEIYLIVNYSVQKHYIRTHEGSFAETFYGIRRFSLANAGGPLPLKERRLSLLVLVLLDYTRHKLEAVLERWKNQSQPLDNFKDQVLRIHRITHLIWSTLSLSTLLGYMTGRTYYHSPLLRLVGVGLQTAPDEPTSPKDLSHLSLIRQGIALVGPSLARCLELGAFLLQFLQWWQLEGPRPQLTALPTPLPPPELPGAAVYSDICPLCLQKRRIDTVLPVSGFVFCYRCIAVHLSKEGTCPVTKYPAKATDLVRIYSDT